MKQDWARRKSRARDRDRGRRSWSQKNSLGGNVSWAGNVQACSIFPDSPPIRFGAGTVGMQEQ